LTAKFIWLVDAGKNIPKNEKRFRGENSDLPVLWEIEGHEQNKKNTRPAMVPITKKMKNARK
jgi:hypothetical protein